jgi:hypothetical protein
LWRSCNCCCDEILLLVILIVAPLVEISGVPKG